MSLHITLRQLQVFREVARQLSFTRAAEVLHLTQPAVSMQVRQLEDSVGLPLVEQVGRRICLTDAGQRVLECARQVQESLDGLADTVHELRGLERGSLTLAVTTTAKYFAPLLLARFRELHPGIRLSLKVVNREALLAMLAGNDMDMAIMGQPPDGHDEESEAFLDNRLIVIARPDHPLAGVPRIGLTDLCRQPFIVREAGSGTRAAIERFMAGHGLALDESMEMESSESIKQAVQAGLGLGIVSEHTVRLELETERLCLLDVVDFPILRQWYVVRPRGRRISAAARAFRALLLSEAGAIIGRRGRLPHAR